MNFGVWNDYGRLREVAVGTTEGLVVPGYSDAYPPEVRELTRNYAGKPIDSVPELREIMPRAQEQLDQLARIYSDRGVIVHRPRPFSEIEWAYQSELQVGGNLLFPADPIWVIGKHVIESQFRQASRNKERFPLRELLAKQIEAHPEVRVHSCPVTAPIDSRALAAGRSGDYFLEGGDILICGNEGRDILVGVDEIRSSSAKGVEWLRRQLSDDGYRVTPVPLRLGAPIHLLGAIGVVGPEAALIYRPAFAEDIPEPIKHWDLIDITREEALAGGPCAVMLDPKTIIVTAETPRLADLLAQRGLDVISVPFGAVTQFDGAVRCATFVMRRDRE